MKKLIAFSLSLFIVSSSFAQTRQPTTGGTTGGGSNGLTNFGSSGFGATSGTTGGITGGTSSGLSSGLGGGTGAQGFTFNSGLGMGASSMGMSGMGGMGRSGFGGMGGMMGMGGMGMGGMGMGGMGMGGQRGGTNGRGGTSGQQQYQIRPTVKLGFEVAKPNSQQRTQQFTSTIARLPQPERFSGVSVKVDGRTAIASGKLSNKADANLLKNLLLMEPGIYEVDISALTGEKKTTSPSDRSAEQVPAVPAPR